MWGDGWFMARLGLVKGRFRFGFVALELRFGTRVEFRDLMVELRGI